MKNIQRLILFASLLVLSLPSLRAQMGFSHSIGAGIYFGSDSYSYAVVYNPNIHYLTIGENASLSAGTYMALGFSGSGSSFGGSSFSFVYDIPLVTEFNIGLGTPDSEGGFGAFIGGGYGISKIASIFQGNNSARGLLGSGGVRFMVREKVTTVRLSYLIDGSDSRLSSNVFSIGMYYMVGSSTIGGSTSSSSRNSSRKSSSSRGTSRKRK